MANSSTPLPRELLHFVVDKLSERVHDPECYQALATCSLVSKALYGRAYQHLYSTIRLDFANGGNPRLSRLDDVLGAGLASNNEQSLVRSIRHFTLVSVYERDSQDAVNPTWCQIMARILTKLQGRLESLTLQSIVHATTQWTVLGPAFIQAFTHITHSPSFKALRLVGFTHIPPSILFRAANIERLELRHCTALEATNEPEAHFSSFNLLAGYIQPTSIRTDSLKTAVNVMRPRNPATLGPEGRPARRFAKLTQATAYGMVSTEHVNQFAQILLLGRSTLQHLHIVIEHQFTGLPTFPITSFPNLRSVRITLSESFPTSLLTQRSPPDVCRALLDVMVEDFSHVPSGLRSIEIQTDVWCADSRMNPFVGAETEWLRLARVVGHEKYRPVEVLTIVLQLRFDSEEKDRAALVDHTRRVIRGFQDIFTARLAESGVHRKVVFKIRQILNDW